MGAPAGEPCPQLRDGGGFLGVGPLEACPARGARWRLVRRATPWPGAAEARLLPSPINQRPFRKMCSTRGEERWQACLSGCRHEVSKDVLDGGRRTPAGRFRAQPTEGRFGCARLPAAGLLPKAAVVSTAPTPSRPQSPPIFSKSAFASCPPAYAARSAAFGFNSLSVAGPSAEVEAEATAARVDRESACNACLPG